LLSNTNTTATTATTTTTTTTPSKTATTNSKTTASSTTALIPDGGLNPCVIRVLGVGGAGCNAVGIYLFFRSFRIRGRGQLLHP
jgi:cell division protein FtsZ